MDYALQPGEGHFDVGTFTQKVLELDGERRNDEADEVVYVLEGAGRATVGGAEHELRPGVSLFVPAGTAWTATGGARGVSVLVHDPAPAAAPAVVDVTAVEKGTATAGRQ